MRRKFPDGKGGTKNVRTGKLIAQGAHASMKAILNLMDYIPYSYENSEGLQHRLDVPLNSSLEAWLNGGFAKIAVYVDTEEELLELYQQAKDASLPCSLITDSGRTEFGGVPTNTCIAIGPDYSDKIDKITKGLRLL